MVAYNVIGQPIGRADGTEKATGTARFTADVLLPGALWGKELRSPHPHARIVRIDTARAKEVPGVHAVLTGADVKGILFGNRYHDIPVLAQDRVRFAGERVAAVAAESEDVAQQAVELIEVEYQELPAVFDPLEALKEDAPLLHPDANSYFGLPEPLEKPTNAFVHVRHEKGNMEEGFAQADLVVEHSYSTHLSHQGYLEPYTCLVWIDDDGRVQVWASCKTPYGLRGNLAGAIGVPQERVHINHAYIGGDFGGKGTMMDIPICYFLALRTGRPVKMEMEFTEEFMAGNPRHPSVTRLKTGVKHDGTLVAHQAQVIFNSGAYGGYKPLVRLRGAFHVGGAYRIPHVAMEELQVYTNTVPGGHMRAPGEPQTIFAMESHMDAIARRLNMDPMELRMKNLLVDGDVSARGERYEAVRARETLEAVVKAAKYSTPKPPHVGRGIGMTERSPGGGEGHAAVTLNADGSVVLHTAIFEQGTGTYTTQQQIVAEELGLPADRVRVEVFDTDALASDSGMGGSRATRIEGTAAYEAAREARRELLRLAAELLGWSEEKMALEGEEVVSRDTGERRSWRELLERAGHSITARGSCQEQTRPPITSFTAQVAEVSVDSETGEVRLLRFTTAHDVGTILNPIGHQGQIDGAVIQGVGYAMIEELSVEQGQVTTLSFGDYKLPNIQDIPPMETVLLEPATGVGPYSIKGIGENPIAPVAPAIANAIEDAVGVRIRDLPITAEKLHRALKEQSRSG